MFENKAANQFVPLIEQLNRMEVDLTSLDLSERDYASQRVEEIKSKFIDLLIEAVDSEDEETRRGAVYGLSKLEDHSAIFILIRSLSDPDDMVRSWACEGLGKFSNKTHIPYLVEALFDESIYVYYSASTALKKYSNDDLWPELEAKFSNSVKSELKRVIKLVGEIGEKRALVYLTSMLEDENPSIRYECVEAMRCIGDSSSIEFLIEHLSDPSRDVRICCIQSLSWLKVKKAIPYLVRIYLYNEDLRSFVATAITDIAGSEVILILNDALDLMDDLIETKLNLITSHCIE